MVIVNGIERYAVVDEGNSTMNRLWNTGFRGIEGFHKNAQTVSQVC